MKNKILILLVVLTGAVILNSCYKESKLFHDPESGDTQYAQFFTDNARFEVNKLNAQGEPANLDVTIDVKILGDLPSTDLNVDYEITTEGIADSVAASSDMYSFAANSFTVPAGQDYGSVTMTLINQALPLDTSVMFKLRLKEGSVKLAGNSTEMLVTLYKKNFCPYVKEDLVGDWSVVEIGYYDNYNETYHITAGEGDTLWFTNSFWYNAPTAIWGETITDMGEPVPVIFDASDILNPNVYMARQQYLQTTDDTYAYWISDMNTYGGNNDNPWVYDFCAKTLDMYFYIPYGAPDGGLVDIVSVTLDYSGTKKVAYVKHSYQNDPRIIKK